MSDALDRILDRGLSQSVRAFGNARAAYRAVRNGLLGLGLSTAVFLPLASSDRPEQTPDEPPPPPTPIHNEVHYHTEPARGTVTAADAPDVHLDLTSYNIQFAPPIGRDWHRTTFSQNGDEFWALPDASFVMKFTRADSWQPGCFRESCGGDFSFQSERYRHADQVVAKAWTVSGRDIRSTLTECERLSGDVLTPIVQCRFSDPAPTDAVMTQTGGNPDLCIWMRRSDHLEQLADDETETIALDIRWQRIGREPNGCPPLYR